MLGHAQPVWMTVPIDEYPQQGQSIVKIRIAPVILTYFASENKDRLIQTTQTAHL